MQQIPSSLDTLSPKERSRRMSLVRSKDTKPELFVRQMVHGMGFRYRLHGKGLPGRPDLVFRSRRKLILVHGCFWHGHTGCSRARTPKSPETRPFWIKKLGGNKERDARQMRQLRGLGWRVLLVWECETDRPAKLRNRLLRFLRDPHRE